MQRSHGLKKVWLLALALMLVQWCNAVAWSQQVRPDTSGRRQPRLVEEKGHMDSVTSVAFSPDERFVLTGSSDATSILWDKATGLEV
ncbi:MAG TPA: hypothetical protein VNI02_10755, partial [Blastocatellia bacterium]|nr:hypothetical protein [Blastocatellia bacterium]